MAKVCSKCKRELPEEMYTKDKYKKDGLRSNCKDCTKKYTEENKERIYEHHKQWMLANPDYDKIHYQDNRDRYINNFREYYKNNSDYYKQYRERNAEIISVKSKIYEQENKEKIAQRKKEYNKQHPEVSRAYTAKNKEKRAKQLRDWKKNNRDRCRVNEQKREAAKRELPNNLTTKQWENIKRCFNNKCAYCGEETHLTQEHFVALSKGGEYTLNNIIPSCTNCNSSKGDKDFFDWYPNFKKYSAAREKKILKYLGYNGTIQQLKLI